MQSETTNKRDWQPLLVVHKTKIQSKKSLSLVRAGAAPASLTARQKRRSSRRRPGQANGERAEKVVWTSFCLRRYRQRREDRDQLYSQHNRHLRLWIYSPLTFSLAFPCTCLLLFFVSICYSLACRRPHLFVRSGSFFHAEKTVESVNNN